jgi:hypothetical protein
VSGRPPRRPGSPGRRCGWSTRRYALQLQHRIRRYNADHDIAHGDVVALALDIWLRAKGYPPDLKPPERDAP